MGKYQKLLSPIKIGNLTLKNRIIMAPMSVHMTNDGSVTDQEIAYYERRAMGGAALITVGSVLIRPDGDFGGQLYIEKDERIPDLKKLTAAIHKHESLASAQIHHSGRETNCKTSGYQPVCPSLFMPETEEYDVPRVLTTKEVGDYVEYYAQAIRRAKEANFDAVELHCAHNYLIAEFMSPLTNKRTDKYGGSFLGRMRFITEIIERARELVGKDFTITARISGDELREGAITMELAAKNAAYLESLGISALSVSAEMYPYVRTCPNMYHKPAVNVYLAENVKQFIKIPVITAGRINTPELAEEILEKGKADIIAMGRILLADPDFPNKVIDGKEDEIIPCIACNKGCHDRNADDRYVKCTLNTMTGRELFFDIIPAQNKKKVMVIGGGPAGMEAARVAALRGHNVKLFDQNGELGGRLILAGMPPHKQGYLEAVSYLKRAVSKLNIDVVLNTKVTKELVEKERPDAVIIAAGASPIIPRIEGCNQCFVVTADDILSGKKIAGENVVVIGGGSVGAETAHYLMEQSPRKVILIEMMAQIAGDMPQDSRIVFMKEIEQLLNLKIMTNTKVLCIGEKSITVEKECIADTIEGIDTIVIAIGATPNNSLKGEVESIIKEVYVVGDADKPKDAVKAVFEGSKIARQI